MAAGMRIAVFNFGESLYSGPVECWAAARKDVSMYHSAKNNPSGNHHHYLNYHWHHAEQPFDRHIFLLKDSVACAPLFSIMRKSPGLLLLDSNSLFAFAMGISHSLDDPFGTGALLEQAGIKKGDSLYRLLRIGAEVPRNQIGIAVAAFISSTMPLVCLPSMEFLTGLSRHAPELEMLCLPIEETEERLDAILAAVHEEPSQGKRLDKKPPSMPYDSFAEQQSNLIRGQFFQRHYFCAESAELEFRRIFGKIGKQTEQGEE